MHTVSLTHQLVAIQDDFDLDKIIESGQCFRPQKLSDGRYRFLSGGALLYLTPLGDGQYDAAWYGSDREYWADYFDLGRNYAALRCSLAGQSSYLDKSLDFGQGIRILHQGPMGNAHHLSHLPAQEHSGHPHRRGTPCPVLRRTTQCRRR